MERRCGICGSYEVTEQNNGALRCEKCGAMFSNEKEYEKALKKLTSKEDKIAQKEAEEKAAKERAELNAKRDRELISSAIPRVTVAVAKKNVQESDKEKTFDIILCRAEDDRIVAEIEGKRDFAREFSVKKIEFTKSTYEYKPSKLVFTGASSGGFAMGGFHETEAGWIKDDHATGNYMLTLNIDGDENYLIDTIRFAEDVAQLVKNTSGLDATMTIVRDKEGMQKSINETYKLALQLGWDNFKTLSRVDEIVGSHYPGKTRANLIIDTVTKAMATRSIEELYDEAVALYNEDDDEKKKTAIEQLKTIAPYKNAEAIIREYEIAEKERAEAERNAKYEQALKYSASNDFGELSQAVTLFKQLGDYKDSEIRLKGAENNLNSVSKRDGKKQGLLL